MSASTLATRGGLSTGNLQIQISEPGSPDLVRDYLASAPQLARFFSGHPHDPDAYRRKAQEVARRLPPSARRAAGEAIRPTSAAAAERLQRVIAGEGVFVTTGQQAGLFGGPLYTVYKILSAVRLAKRLEAVLHVPVAPLFWVASDDHDWAEVNHTWALTAQNELRRIELAEDATAPPHPMSRRLLDDQAGQAIADLTGLLPATEFTPALEALLRDAYRPGRNMGEAFEELLAGLFPAHDLLIVNPAHPRLKQLAAPVLQRELENAAAHADLLAKQSARLEQAGYHTQVVVSPDAANVFLHDEYGRDRLVRDDGVWQLRRTRRRLEDDELYARLRDEPTAFSPNVLLRPVVESTLFPTVAYVGGPAEVSYFAQIGCLFQAHDIMAPVVMPRFSVMLIESKIRKVLDKFSMAPGDFARPFHEVVSQVVREETPEEVNAALAGLREALGTGYDRLAAAAEQVDPTLRGWLEGQRNNALGQTEAAGRKIATHLRKKNDVELEQLRKAALNLYPEGTAQERMLNALPFLARYGMNLLQDLLDALECRLDAPSPGWTGVEC